MNYTENLTLGLPEYGESADVADLNRNSGILDAYCYNTRQMECEPYDSTKTYMSGDLSIHNEVVYECNTDNTTGTWDDSKWDSTTLAEQIAKAKQSGGGQVTKEASGNPIELTDAANAPLVKCVTEIQGSQDLHGYDKPWVGGAGKNKARTYTFTGTNSSVTFAYDDNGVTLSGTASGNTALPFSSSASNFTFNLPAGTYTSSMTPTKEGVTVQIVEQSTGNVLSNNPTFTIANDMVVYFRLSVTSGTVSDGTYKVQLESGSTATTFAPYSNICPITAYTEGEIEVRGKNMCSGLEMHSFDSNGLNNDGPNNRVRTTGYIKVVPSMSYTVNAITSVSGKTIQASVSYYETDDFTTPRIGFANWENVPMTVTVPSRAKYVRFLLRFSDDANVVVRYFDNVQLEQGESATDYEPYTSTTHTTTYPSAIYRGSEDVVKGEVVTEWGMIASYAGETLPGEWISDRDEYAPGTTPTTGAQVAYALATPTTSSVTPTNLPIKSLSGYNHIESSTGDMEVEYITEEYQPLVDLIQSSNGHTYSTQEQVVGKWIDGSTIYEKTLKFTGTFYGSVTIGNTGVSNVDCLVVVNISGHTLDDTWRSLSFAHSDAQNNAGIFISSTGDVSMRTGSSVTAQYAYDVIIMTIRYTKTTQTRSLSAPVTSQKAQIEPLTDKTEEVPTEEEKAVNEEENNDER